MKQEFEEAMKPGVKYPGYGWVNNFHEFQFTPSQKGKNEGRMKILTEGNGYTVHTTRDNIIIHVKIPRKESAIERVTEFLRVQQEVLEILREYDLSVKPKTTKAKK